MTNEINDTNIRFKPELGEHNIGKKLNSDSITNTYDFEVEAETVFKNLAEDIYEGKEAGLREPLTNSITAIFKAIEEGYMEDPSEGIILFELYESNDTRRLKLRDNGVGMTRDEIDNIISKIGTSTSRYSTNHTGKFGMGFLATWMLVGGVEGGFIMHTNPRGVEEGPISGIWNSNNFSEYETDALTGGLKSDEYGTKFDIMLSQDIETEEIINWIYKYSKWSRIPILFRHYTDDGLTDEEFMPRNILDMYKDIEKDEENISKYDVKRISNDSLKYYTIESEHFTAVNSNLREDYYKGLSNVILLDVPIKNIGELSQTNKFPLHSLEIRINTEIPVVVDGPHEGKYVVSNSEAKDAGEQFISQSLLTVNDIVTPAPTGTRDSLQSTEKFANWLAEQFYDIHYESISKILNDVNNLDDYCNLSKEDKREFRIVINKLSDSNIILNKSDILNIQSRADTTFDDEFKHQLCLMHERQISLAPKETKGISKNKNRTEEYISDLIMQTYNTNSTVYMGHRLTQEKAEFIWAADNDHHVVRVDTKKQDEYEKYFGWNKLNDIDYETSLKMDDKTRQEFTDPDDSIEDKTFKLHIDSYSTIKNVKVSQIKEAMENKNKVEFEEDNSSYAIQKLILFQRGKSSVSKHDYMVSDIVATASVSTEIYDYLIDIPNVWGSEKAINHDIIIQGYNKKYNITKDELPENVVTHIVDEETIRDFREPKFIQNVGEFVKNWHKTPENAIYLPMSEFEYKFGFEPNQSDRIINHNTKNNIKSQGMKEKSVGFRNTVIINDVKLYLKGFVDEHDAPVVNALETISTKWSEGGKEIIELFENQT